MNDCGFWKSVSSGDRVKPWFFVTFNIIISHIFCENFIKIPGLATPGVSVGHALPTSPTFLRSKKKNRETKAKKKGFQSRNHEKAVVLEDVKIFSININYFRRFFGFFEIFYDKKLMTLAYYKWCQHFFTFNLL